MIQAPMCFCPDPGAGYWAGAVFGVVMTLLLVGLLRASGFRVYFFRHFDHSQTEEPRDP